MKNLLRTLVNKLKREPVRMRAYSLALVFGGWLVYEGHLDVTDADGLATALAIVLGVEKSREKVTPWGETNPKHRA